jgi:hypothetical protein
VVVTQSKSYHLSLFAYPANGRCNFNGAMNWESYVGLQVVVDHVVAILNEDSLIARFPVMIILTPRAGARVTPRRRAISG